MKKTLLALALFTTTAIIADTAYVSDKLEIMVRSGKTSNHRIIATLESGQKINIIEKDAASGFSKVSLGESGQGWVLTRLLSKSPSVKSRLAKAESELTKLRTRAAISNEQITQLDAQKGNLDIETSELKKHNTTLSRDLNRLREISGKAIQINTQRDILLQRIVSNERDLETVKRENDTLKASDAQDWFLIGSGVLIFGILLGFLLPRLSWRKKPSWKTTF